MCRLTEKYNDNYVTKDYFGNGDIMKDTYNAIQKLGKLEDLEEQLGCPLEVFFKVIATKKVYIVLPKCNLNRVYFVNLDFSAQDILTLGFFVGGLKFLFNEYKITWWLKEDKSE